MRKLLLAGGAFGCLMLGPLAAKADSPIYTFSGIGSSGNLVGGNEGWSYVTSAGDVVWGSPGFGSGRAQYGETISATDFEITFASTVTIDPNQIDVAGVCPGGTGTIFCEGANPATAVQWPATLVNPHTIVFDAPSGDSLKLNGDYSVNVFLESGAAVLDGAFTGDWSGATVPEPTSLALLGMSFLILGWLRAQRR